MLKAITMWPIISSVLYIYIGLTNIHLNKAKFCDTQSVEASGDATVYEVTINVYLQYECLLTLILKASTKSSQLSAISISFR